MPVSQGLLAAGGIGEGLGSFVDTYTKLKQQQKENKQRDIMTGLLANKQGLNVDNASGLITPNEVGQAEQTSKIAQAGLLGAQATQGTRDLNAATDAGSPESQSISDAALDTADRLRSAGHEKLAQSLERPGLSAHQRAGIMQSPEVKEALGAVAAQTKQAGAERVANITGQYHLAGAKVRGATSAGRLDETKNTNAARAGQAFENDKVIVPLKKNMNSLTRARDLLTGDEPITAVDLNAVKQDYINALTADNVATEGKVNREMVNTAAEMWNRLEQKVGKVADIRKAEPEAVRHLLNLVNNVGGSYRQAIGDQALNIHDSYQDNTNERVKSTIKRKLQKYAPDHYAEIYGDEDAPAQTAPARTTDGIMRGAPTKSAAPGIMSTDPLDGRVISDGKQTLIRKGGKWVPK